MGLSKQEAYRILELPPDPSADDIRSSYKKLALKWHPDKHTSGEGQEEATKKFQQVSAAYKRLTNEHSDDDEVYMTTSDMFDLFAHIFFHANVGRFCNCGKHSHYSYDSDESSYSDDSDIDVYDHFERARFARRSDDFYRRPHNLSEAEANKNAQELIQEEEKEKKKAEKKRAKKKRNKERKKQKEREKKESDIRPDEKENTQKNSNSGPKEEEVKINVSDTKKDKNPSTKQNNLNKKSTSKTTNKPLQKDKKIPDVVPSKTTIEAPTSKSQQSKTPVNTDSQKINGVSSTKSKTKDDSSGTEEEDVGWDTSSAFFARVASKGPSTQTSVNSKSTPSSVKSHISSSNIINSQAHPVPLVNGKSEPAKVADPQPQVQIDPVVLKSRQIAVQGNEMANQNNYQEAVKLFTQAIALDSRDCRFFGNRSYCFDRLTQYEKALQDADSAISLASEWPKGYFRRGRALAGLKLYGDAETSFAQVLKLDKHCEDAMFELDRVRVAQLVEMGFPAMQSQIAIEKFVTVQAALEALLAGKVKVPDICEEVYRSDEEDEKIVTPSEAARISGSTSFQNYTPIRSTISTQNGIHSPPGECSSLWIGNVNPEEVTERNIRQIFNRFGNLNSVRMLPNRYCAFVNYDNPESAAQALKTVQGYQIGGQELLLRYPNNSNTSNLPQASPNPKSIIKEFEYIQQQENNSKLTGPVNGDECYFWRTSGCVFGDKCRYRHIPESKAADLGKVREKYGGKLRPKPANQVIGGMDDGYY